jgi:hypothetical protein
MAGVYRPGNVGVLVNGGPLQAVQQRFKRPRSLPAIELVYQEASHIPNGQDGSGPNVDTESG